MSDIGAQSSAGVEGLLSVLRNRDSGGIAPRPSDPVRNRVLFGDEAVTITLSEDAETFLLSAETSPTRSVLPTVTDDQARQAALDLVGTFLRATDERRQLTGVEAARVGRSLLIINRAAGFASDPLSLGESERSSLVRDFEEFDQIIAEAGTNTLSRRQAARLDTLIGRASDALGFSLDDQALSTTLRAALEPDAEPEASIPARRRISFPAPGADTSSRVDLITFEAVTSISIEPSPNDGGAALASLFDRGDLSADQPTFEVLTGQAFARGSSGLGPVTGLTLSGLVNEISGVSRLVDVGADTDLLMESETRAAAGLLSQFDAVTVNAGNSLLTRDQIRTVSRITANLGDLLQAPGDPQPLVGALFRA